MRSSKDPALDTALDTAGDMHIPGRSLEHRASRASEEQC